MTTQIQPADRARPEPQGPTPPGDVVRARMATASVYVVFGVLVGVLNARMPAFKAHAGLSDGALGVALLGYSIGSLITISIAGRLVARFGSALITVTGLVIASISFAFAPLAASFGALIAVLGGGGAGLGLTDAAMNAHAVVIEKRYGRSIMSSFHGCASLGMLIGAALGAVSAHLGLPLAALFLPVDGLSVVLVLAARQFMLTRAADQANLAQSRSAAGDHRAPWSLTLALLAGVAFLALLTEWAIGNWSAVHLQDDLHTDSAFAAYGFAAFTFAMVCGRLSGDRLIRRFGPPHLLRTGGLLVGTALIAGLVVNSPLVFVIACGAVGLGMSVVVPVIFTTAGNIPGTPSASAVSKVIGIGYTGSMVGPPVIGALADLTSLTTALFLIAGSGLVIGVAGPLAIRRARAGV